MGTTPVAVFGWCPILNRFAIYQLTLDETTFEMQIAETLPEDSLSVVALGSGAARLIQQIDFIREHGDKFHRTARIPKLAADALIEQNVGDVGGSLSIGLATRDGFRLYSHVTPVVPGKPDAKISFNGIELHPDLMVGHYMISTDMIV